jgi:hypothetical protein
MYTTFSSEQAFQVFQQGERNATNGGEGLTVKYLRSTPKTANRTINNNVPSILNISSNLHVGLTMSCRHLLCLLRQMFFIGHKPNKHGVFIVCILQNLKDAEE